MIIGQPENPTPLVIMASGKEVLRIERDHVVLHGKRIDDAGEAHRALVLAFTQVAQPWQPIETAPKDGTRILACVLGGQVRVVQCGAPGAAWREDAWSTVFPTLWMPLPAPPR